MASVYALGLIGGSIATIAASYYGNKLNDEKGVTSISSESLEEPIQDEPVQDEPVQEEPVQEEPVQEPEPSSAVAPSLPEIDSMAGGGFGRPSWAPLNANTPSMSLQGSTAGNLLSKLSGTYKRTVQDIQKDLKDNDDQLRLLRTTKYLDNQSKLTKESEFNIVRNDYLTELANKQKNEKYMKFYNDEINKLLNPKTTNESYIEILKKEVPQPADKTSSNWKDLWISQIYDHAKKMEKNDPEGIKPNNNEDKNLWFKRIENRRVQNTSEPVNIEAKLELLLNKNKEFTIALELSKEKEEIQKSKYDSLLQVIKNYRSKILETDLKLSETTQKRDILLSELSDYQLPKGLFEITKQPVQKIYNLPKGEELTSLLKELSQKSDEINEIDNKISEHISKSLDSDGKLSDPDKKKYDNLTQERKGLEQTKNTIISKIEGRPDEPLYKGQVDNTIDSPERKDTKKYRKLVYPRPLDQKKLLTQAKNKIINVSNSTPDTKSIGELQTTRIKDLENIKSPNSSLGTSVELHDFTGPIAQPSADTPAAPQAVANEFPRAPTEEEIINELGGKRHSTRRHSVRFKPSRFKTQRTY
jgi:hypothetical protein